MPNIFSFWNQQEITPTPSPTINLTPTPTPSITPTQTLTPTPTPTSTLTPTPTPTLGSWTPALLEGIYDWWSSETGVDVSGGEVLSWEGYYGTFLSPVNTILYNAVDSDWDNKPSLLFNSGNSNAGFYMEGLASALNTDKTIILVSKLIGLPTDATESPTFSLGRILTNPYTFLGVNKLDGNFIGFNNQPNQPTYFGSFAIGDYMFSMMRYNRTTGDYEYYSSRDSGIVNQNFSQITGLPEVNYGGGSVLIGRSADSSIITPQMSVVQFIAMDSYISVEDIDRLKNYLMRKYGI